MTENAKILASFAYRAKTAEGAAISGTIDAVDRPDADRRLQGLRLQGIELEITRQPPPAKALRGEDFTAFNQQLAQLTSAGLPIEQGLRLIARDMKSGSMARTLELVATELESGKTLPQAIDAHRKQFPPLYAELIDAGIRAGNLPGILLNMGRHVTLVRRLHAAIWRAFSYPVAVLLIFLGVFFFIGFIVVPEFEAVFAGFHMRIPAATELVFAIADSARASGLWIGAAGVVVIALILWQMLRFTDQSQALRERVLLRLPLVGRVLRFNLVARWCDAAALGVDAGIDLPSAIALANDAIGSPMLRKDAAAMSELISNGQPISKARPGLVLPPMIPVAIDLASANGELGETLHALSEMYQQQAELRLGSVQAWTTPMLVCLLGFVIGFFVLSVMAPLISFIQTVSSPGK
jgi:type II secretory pathway component PulF